MENNISESDHDTFYNDEIIDCGPCPHKCQNEIIGIDFFNECFERRYGACPTFFRGTLRDACHVAFSPTKIQDRRPILIYIHDDQNQLTDKFCKNIFCSRETIKYLSDNYIVWPWDITLESNRNILTKIWEEIFSIQFFDNFLVKQCPLLIGIMRLFEVKTNGLITSEYQFKSLLKGDILTYLQTNMNSDRDLLLKKLNVFKEQCNQNEQDLSFRFVRETGLCWEIILEIIKYLPLNDTISAFSTDILPLLNNSKLRFHLYNPSVLFTKIILRNVKPEQIVSLQLNATQLWSKTDLAIFTGVISMTLFNLPYENQIRQYEEYFPKLTRLSLCYNNKLNFNTFSIIFNQLWGRIERLEIHSSGMLCADYGMNQFNRCHSKSQSNTCYKINLSVKYFLFDLGHSQLTSMNNYFGSDGLRFLKSTIDFIKKMQNIQHVQLIINTFDIENFLDIDKWKSLVHECSQLKKIMLQVRGNSCQDNQVIEKALQIQAELRYIRQTIKFQIHFL